MNTALYYKLFDAVHGDIQPGTVHLTSLGQVRLMDNLLLFPKGKENLNKITDNNLYRSALSPVQLKAFSKRQHLVLHNKYASEVWSIGLTALAYVAGGEVSTFYDWSAKQIRYQLILAEIYRLSSNGYSKALTNLFKHMLSLNEKDRPSLERINSCFGSQEVATSLFDEQVLSFKIQNMASFLNPDNQHHSRHRRPTQQHLIDVAVNDLSPVRRIDPSHFIKKDTGIVNTTNSGAWRNHIRTIN